MLLPMNALHLQKHEIVTCQAEASSSSSAAAAATAAAAAAAAREEGARESETAPGTG